MPEIECASNQVKKYTGGRCPSAYCEPTQDSISSEEVRAIVRQIKDQQRQVAQLTTQAKRQAPAVLPDLDALKKSLDDFTAKLSAKGATRQQLNDYNDVRVQDALNDLGRKVNLGQRITELKRQMGSELKRRRRSLTQLTQLLQSKKPDDVSALLSGLGVDVAGLNQTASESDQQLTGWEQAYTTAATGTDEDALNAAQEALQEMHSAGAGPDQSSFDQLRSVLKELLDGFGKPLAKVTDEEIRSALSGFMSDVVDALNSGEVQQARQALQSLPREVRAAFLRAPRVTASNRDRFLQQLEAIQARLGG